MAAAYRKQSRRLTAVLLASAALCAYGASSAMSSAFAQTAGSPVVPMNVKVPDGAKLELSANELVYNRDNKTVTVRGAVQMNYGGYQMVAQSAEYNQTTGRMIATGNIELITPDGNRIYGDHMDVTNKFADGFVDALRIEMPGNTRIVAEKGRRIGGTQMVLEKGVYTACLPCTQVNRAPIWQVKAQRVIQNNQTHTVRLEHAKFELFGHPIAYLPYAEVPDNTVKRKSGFLFPSFSVSQKLGVGVSVPYYYVISPSMDATVTGTGYSSQGFMLEGEFRQRFENGTTVLRAAGIDQLNPHNFSADTTDYDQKFRGLVASKGDFKINPRWAFGWDAMLETDNDFARTYNIKDLDQTNHTNQVYLTGIGRRNYFDMRAFYFDVQDASDQTRESKQAIVYPNVDYHYIDPRPVAGGQLSATVNFTNISRRRADIIDNVDDLNNATLNDRFRGLEGTDTRLTSELEWKRTFTTPQGLLLTPLLAARGDAFGLNMDAPNSYSPSYVYQGQYDDSDAATRGLLTAGIEAKYPFLITTNNSTHIFEPIAQVYARNNEQLAGRLPNEDSQSLVFDATNLFDRDKFSGYDRVEGGTRANVGFRYTGNFDSGYKLQSIFGQSFQLAGQNSYAVDDLVGTGQESGLEHSRSDYVGAFGVETPGGFSLSTSYRLDQKSLDFQRGDAALGFRNSDFQTTLIYTHIKAQPNYGFTEDNDEIQTRAQINFKQYWSVFGTVSYDLNNSDITRSGIGLSYEDECTVFSIAYLQHKDTTSATANDWTIGARITFRTLGDINLGNGEKTTF